MNYIDVYFARRNHMGETIQEIAQNSGERSFEKWLKESPHTVWKLSVDRGLYFPGLILTNKDTEGQKEMLLNVSRNVPIRVGDLLNWEGEKWIILRKERKVNETYQTFSILRCNYLVQWIDEDGTLQSCWAYFVGTLSQKLRENFRVIYSGLVDSTNKTAELILPHTKIRRQTRFILNEEAWRVSEFDQTSVPGISYISITEDTINTEDDDLTNNIADVPKLAKYEIISSDNKQKFNIGAEISPSFYILKNCKVVDEPYELISENKKVAKIENGKMIAKASGEVNLKVKLINHPEVMIDYPIIVSKAEEFYAYIECNEKVRVGQELEAKIITNGKKNFIFELEKTDLALISDFGNNYCKISVNKKNKLGEINLKAYCKDCVIDKKITIVPLW